jgi:hypothetical protein
MLITFILHCKYGEKNWNVQEKKIKFVYLRRETERD